MLPDDNSGETIPAAGEGPQRLSIRGVRPAVTRISRRAVLLSAIVAAALVLVVLLLGFRGHGGEGKASANDNPIRPSGPVESVRSLPQDYRFDVNRLSAGYESMTRPPLPATRPAGPSAQDQALARAMRDLAEQRRKLLEEQRKEQQAAFDSPLLLGRMNSPTTGTAAAAAGGPTTMPTLVMLGPDAHHAAMTGVGSAGQDTGAGAEPSNHQSEREAFLTHAAAVEPYLSKPLLDPISKYELKAGSIIAGALVTAIDTDLPGEVIGQVTENVYDTASGNYLLIPQGSKLLGRYQSLVSNGQNRVLLVWQRLICPNGNSIVLEGMPGTDEAGTAGLRDKVDYHLDKLAQAAALTTALAYAGNLARDPQNRRGNGGSDVIGDAVAQQANRVGERILEKELDVQPTITVRPGWPLRVLVNKDMILAPYVP